MKSQEEIQSIIKDIISNELHVKKEELNESISFHDLGLDSVNSIFLLAEIENRLSIEIDPMSVYDNPSISSFSSYIHSQLQ